MKATPTAYIATVLALTTVHYVAASTTRAHVTSLKQRKSRRGPPVFGGRRVLIQSCASYREQSANTPSLTHIGHDEKGEHDEGEDADGPSPAGGLEHLMQLDGDDDAANTGPDGADAKGEGAAATEVMADGADAGDEEKAKGDAEADALAEEELPKFGAYGGEEGAEDVDDGPGEEDDPAVAAIKELADDDTADEQAEELCNR
jgi:hypothetical protein